MYYKFLVSLIIFSLLLSNVPVQVFAQENSESDNTTTESDTTDEEADTVEASKKLDEIKNNIKSSQTSLTDSVSDTSLLEQRLGDTTELVDTLEGQLKNIDEQYESTQQRIVLITVNIEKNQEKLEALMDEIAILVRQIEQQKKKLKELMLLIYFQAEQVGFFDSNELQTIKLLLADDTVSDILDKADSLSMLEYSMTDLIGSLEVNRDQLNDDKEKVEIATKELTEMQTTLNKEKVFLVLQKTAKEKLLEATKGEEKLYTALLEEARKEQIQIRRDFLDLLKVYSEYQDILNKDGFATDDFSLSGVLSWPVSPGLGISAYFHDASYKKALGIRHDAIDIRTPQSTPLMAPADGVVLKTKGGEGLDYHYIVIGHNEEVMTLFGHVYDIFVVPGQTVKRGDIIGLSGAMPGTRGAGWLTTGPHLHFEVLKNGKNVDPLPYMDQTALPEKYRK